MEFDALRECYIDGIIEIENEAFRQPWSREAFKRELTNPVAEYVVALERGAVTAYGGFWHILDEGHITNIAVKNSDRGRGIGGLLMAGLLARAAEIKVSRMTLEVRPSNTVARRLYEKYGFKCAGVRKGYYPDGEDAMIYWTEDANAAGY